MFDPKSDHYRDLMIPTLEAIYQLVGRSRDGVHIQRIHDKVVENQRIPRRLVNLRKKRTAKQTYLQTKLSSARTILKKEGLIVGSESTKRQGHWALTDKALDDERDEQIQSLGTGSGSLVPRQSQDLRLEIWKDVTVQALGSGRFYGEVEVRPDGTVFYRIIPK